MKLRALIHASDEGGFWAEVPELPGCVSEGTTFEEAIGNIRIAAQGWLEVAAKRTVANPKTQVVELDLTEKPVGLKTAYCSYCRKSHRDTGPLAEGPDHVFICYRCIMCARISSKKSVAGAVSSRVMQVVTTPLRKCQPAFGKQIAIMPSHAKRR